ncbi:Uncharacterized conserved protein YeaO, DUF488 family [Microbulbifer donghaiensis]|uniref:Uncharacterized conserved protein YeaO, DUF488 family n=1 Tax=Microbulbifer donghaiensis TaxID=494016 RepID=A0A1M5FXT2_9GAMM|nr:DUF488 family protein [Microbulbifer donghaiensis]SHF96345.1 Uncharacterized conserved protein YeaO, DUF488 family [Microbulbifer donghaiensis]
MAVHIVRLGTARHRDEGLRIGTVRRPPRGVPKSEFATRNYYDVWLPQLSPSPEVMKLAQMAASPVEFEKAMRQFQQEMGKPDNNHLLDVLAALSGSVNFSVGCYCEEEGRCHRSVLRRLLEERGAEVI